MEKRSPFFYLGLLLQLLGLVFIFGVGTFEIAFFIRQHETISFYSELWISFLNAFLFLLGYFVMTFVYPLLPVAILQKRRVSCFVVVAGIITWSILLIGLAILVIVNIDSPNALLFQASLMYAMAGWMLASISNRFRSMVKT